MRDLNYHGRRVLQEFPGAIERPQRNKSSDGQRAPAFVKLLGPLPEDQLLADELELLQAHIAGLIDRVFPPAVDSDPHHGDHRPWP